MKSAYHQEYNKKNADRLRVSRAAYYAANRDLIRAKQKAYRDENPDVRARAVERQNENRRLNPNERRAHDLAYRLRKKDFLKQSKERYKLANVEKVAAAKRKWRENNPEKLRAAQLRWDKNNPEKKRVHRENRRARERNAPGVLSTDIKTKLFALQKGKCPVCRSKLSAKTDLDHILPLCLGGANEDKNVQLLCQSCNRSKSKKHPIDFAQSRGMLL